MNRIVLKDFLIAWNMIVPQLENAAAKSGTVATVAERADIITALCEFQYQCLRMGLPQSRNLCEKLLCQLKDPAWHHDEPVRQARMRCLPRPPMPKEPPLPGFETVYAQLRTIVQTADSEMNEIRLAVFSSDNAGYFERDDLFGKQVADSASPQLNAEIKSAGNCLAADEHIAAVFHLMRVAEYGLYALANHLGAKQQKPWPFEFSQWSDVIKAIDIELNLRAEKADQMTRGVDKDQELVFYRGLLTDLNYFKDAYRNPTSHLRGKYDAECARGVFGKVRDFIQKLAPRVSLN